MTASHLTRHRERTLGLRARAPAGRASAVARASRRPTCSRASGDAMQPWAARREMRSKMLWDAFELPSLPPAPVRVGDRWQSTDPFAFEMHVPAADTLGGERCLRADGSASAVGADPAPGSRFERGPSRASGTARPRISCGASSSRARIPDVNYYKVHETARSRTAGTASRRIDGRVAAQCRSSDRGHCCHLRSATAARSHRVLGTPGLDSIYAGGDTASARILLGITYRAGAATPSMRRAGIAARQPECARAHARGALLARASDSAAARPLLERAAADSDYFVRDAAARALHPDSATRMARGELAAHFQTRCASGSRARGHRRRAGTSFRGMASAAFRGWPYGMYVPDDYRGDEPFPLIVYLAGNSGPAIEGVQLGAAAFERTGYLVVYPNAWGGWWRTNDRNHGRFAARRSDAQVRRRSRARVHLGVEQRRHGHARLRLALAAALHRGSRGDGRGAVRLHRAGRRSALRLQRHAHADALSARQARPGDQRERHHEHGRFAPRAARRCRDEALPASASTRSSPAQETTARQSTSSSITRARVIPKKLDFNAATTVHARQLLGRDSREGKRAAGGYAAMSDASIANAAARAARHARARGGSRVDRRPQHDQARDTARAPAAAAAPPGSVRARRTGQGRAQWEDRFEGAASEQTVPCMRARSPSRATHISRTPPS